MSSLRVSCVLSLNSFPKCLVFTSVLIKYPSFAVQCEIVMRFWIRISVGVSWVPIDLLPWQLFQSAIFRIRLRSFGSIVLVSVLLFREHSAQSRSCIGLQWLVILDTSVVVPWSKGNMRCSNSVNQMVWKIFMYSIVPQCSFNWYARILEKCYEFFRCMKVFFY